MSDSPIPQMKDVRALTDLPVFEVAGCLEWMEGPVQVEDNDIESVLEFARAVGSKVLMVQYDYPMFDDYYVDPGEYRLDELFGEEREDEILDLIEERNDELDDLFDTEYDGEPIGASVFVVYEGEAYGMFVQDDALIEEFGETADEFIVRLYMDDEEEED